MIRYETLMLTRTEITNEELSMLEKNIDKIVAAAGGSMSTFDKWGKYRLAYPVQKNDYGIYILARYQVPADKLAGMVKELAQFFRIACSEFVMRHVNVRLEKNAPAAYKKPDSVDTVGTSSVDAFLKEHKMDGLLNAGSRKESEMFDESADMDIEA